MVGNAGVEHAPRPPPSFDSKPVASTLAEETGNESTAAVLLASVEPTADNPREGLGMWKLGYSGSRGSRAAGSPSPTPGRTVSCSEPSLSGKTLATGGPSRLDGQGDETYAARPSTSLGIDMGITWGSFGSVMRFTL